MNYRHLLKEIVKILINLLPNTLFLLLYSNLSYFINNRLVKKVARRENVKLLKELDYSLYKKSDTLFILGSGSSINDLTPEQWEIIKKHDSIGFNFWLIHEFVPTFYVFEENLDKSRNEAFYTILNEKQHYYNDVPLIAKDIEAKGINTNKIPSNLKDNLYFSVDITLPADNKKLFKKHLNYFMSFKDKINKSYLKVIPKKRATLSYLLFLAHEMKYKNIVLCGVDLTDCRFFYFDKKYANSTKPEKDLKEEQIHPTNIKTNDDMSISEIIEVLHCEFFNKYGINVMVGSKKSALYPSLTYCFDEKINSKTK